MVTRAGFALVEVIVATVLLSIGLMAVAATGLFAARNFGQAELTEEVATRCEAIMDSIVAYKLMGTGSLNVKGAAITWTANPHDVQVQALMTGRQPLRLQLQR